MAPNFQSSFIPKETITGKTSISSDRSILSFLGVLLLIISILASVGLFVYKGMLGGELESLKSDLALAESAIDKKAVEEITVFNRKINLIKEILGRHQASSNFLTILSSTTVSGVGFKEFRYNHLATGVLEVMLRGEASNYKALALQENILSNTKEIKSSKFSNLLLVEGNKVGFELSLTIDPSVVIYNPIIPTTTPSIATTTSTSLESDISDIENINMDDLELTDLDI